MSRSIAVVGLGAMGLPISRRLIAAQFDVRGVDPDPAAQARFAAVGGRVFPSAAEAAKGTHAVLVLVVDDRQADDVLFGAAGAAEALPPGGVVMLSLTTSPRRASEIGQRLYELGLKMVDCPVSGGVKRAENGTLSILAAAPADAMEAAQPYLQVLGQVYDLGRQHGQASAVKLINQLLCGVHIAAAAEAVALAERAGIDPRQMYEVVTASSGTSWMFADRVPRMIEDDDRTTAAIDILVKDLGLVLGLGEACTARLQLTQAALGLFREASVQGMGHRNDSSLVNLLRRGT